MLTPENSALMFIDYQGRLAEVVHQSEDLLKNIQTLVKGINILELPIIWLEQYPKGLGETVASVKDLLSERHEPISKMDFGACEVKDVKNLMEKYDREHFIVLGVEAHVCVYQTVKQLLQEGKHVEFVEDCISSRTAENKNIAVRKMEALGAHPTSVEMLLFELMGTAEHPKFREISSLIK